MAQQTRFAYETKCLRAASPTVDIVQLSHAAQESSEVPIDAASLEAIQKATIVLPFLPDKVSETATQAIFVILICLARLVGKDFFVPAMFGSEDEGVEAVFGLDDNKRLSIEIAGDGSKLEAFLVSGPNLAKFPLKAITEENVEAFMMACRNAFLHGRLS